MNLITTDCQKIRDMTPYWWIAISGPFQIIFAMILLFQQLGWAIFTGFATAFFFALPVNIINIHMAKKVLKSKFQLKLF